MRLSIVVFCCILSIAAFMPLAVGHDGPPDPRRIVYLQHQSYVIGMKNLLNSVGATVRDQMILNDFFNRWDRAFHDFNSDMKIQVEKYGSTPVPTEVILRIYTEHVKKNGMPCGNAIWIDTRTNRFCK